MGSPAIWYQNFLNNTVVQCTFEPTVNRSPTCYALQLFQLELKEALDKNMFELHLFFYDTIRRQFFGSQWISNCQLGSDQNKLKLNQTLYFHSSVNDERVVLVCEVVKKETEPWVYGWTLIPIFLRNQPITDCSTNSVTQFVSKRYQLYKGSCKSLCYVEPPLDSNSMLVKQDGILECALQTHDKMLPAIDYIPEFFIVDGSSVPGLQTSIVKSKQPDLAPHFTAILDNIQISYTVSSSQVDAAILDALSRERCYRANKSSQDPTIPKLTLIERRLRIGIHNGLCYVEEPFSLLLTDSELLGCRRSRSLSRASWGSMQNSDYLLARNSARLRKLCADERFVIVFAIDYLIGVEKNTDCVTDAQIVMICWNAWCPYKDGSFTLADTITVPLVGGPRPNPDDVLCFKNLFALEDLASNPLGRMEPKIHLRFNFVIIETADNQSLNYLPTRLEVRSRNENVITPQPHPDITAHVEAELIPESHQMEVRSSMADLTMSEVREQHATIQKSKSVPILNSNSNPYHTEWEVAEAVTPRISHFSRAVSSYFSTLAFPPILNHSGKPTTFVELSTNRPLNMELELNTRLDTHEILIQFMAISTFKNIYMSNLPRSARYFFTLQFYRFDSITTEMLLAHPPADWRRHDPIVFQRVDENGRLVEPQSNGLMVRFTVERYSTHVNENLEFFNYLLNANLCIDVWNADSLMHMGSSSIPLKTILRQGSDAVQLNVQCPIVQKNFTVEPVTTGLLFLKLGNVGHSSHSQLDLYQSRNKAAVISRRLSQVDSNKKLHERAKPLSAIHESALQRFLNTQKLDIQQRKEEIFGNEGFYRLKKWGELKKQFQPTMPKASLKRFIFEEELEAYRCLRNESKASQLLKAVFKSITTNYSICAKAGQVEFFEHPLKNTFAESIICLIDINDPHISAITNTDEWKFFKDAKKIRTPVERDLFHAEKGGLLSLYLNPMETVYLPFKYDPFVRPSHDKNASNRTLEIKARLVLMQTNQRVQVIFKRSDTEEPLAILEIVVQERNHALERNFRWFHEENARCARTIRIHKIPGNKRVMALRSTDPHVLCSLRMASNGGQELLVTCYAPESPFCREFIITMYADHFHYDLVASWGFSLHGVQQLNVDAIQAHTSKIPLFLRQPRNHDAIISFHSSSECLTISPSANLIASSSPQLLSEIKAILVPNFSGKRTILITAVDTNMRKLLNAWLLSARVQEPNIVKSYEITLPLEQVATILKHITIVNPYTIERHYRVHTSNAQLVSVEKEYVKIEANEKASIGLVFFPIGTTQSTTTNVLVFVENAANGQQEEAYSLRIKYVH